MNNKKTFNLNVGTSSILFIFVVLAMISFSVLSLVTALSDYNLTKNVAANTSAYYLACNQAEEQLAQTDAALKQLYDTGISRVGYFEQVGKTMNFAYQIDELQSLAIEVDILYPEASGEPFIKISSWQIVTTGSLEYDDSLPVMK